MNKRPKSYHPAADNYFDLLNYQYVSDGVMPVDQYSNILFEVRVADYNLPFVTGNLHALSATIADYLAGITSKVIPVVNMRGVSLKNGDLLWSFLVELQRKVNANSLIVINVPKEMVSSAVHGLKTDNDIFWNREKFLVVFPSHSDGRGNHIFNTEIFGGQSVTEYRVLRTKLNSTHFTFDPNLWKVGENELSDNTKMNMQNSGIFVTDSAILQNFELIIKIDGKTLFEHSMAYILNTNADTKENDYSGYKLINSHFRLGSKVHIRDFVYAKRIFQNSFFTNRFAFICAKYIINQYPGIRSLTLVGYGLYSQLLVNRIEKILLKYTGGNINHNIVSDAESPHFTKNIIWNDATLIVVPINTTFSTTIKIENLVRAELKGKKHTRLLGPSYNLIVVTHGDFTDHNYTAELNAFLATGKIFTYQGKIYNPPYRVLNWRRIDPNEKLIHVETNPPESIHTEQRYYITVPSELYLPDNCKLCFSGYGSRDPDEEILHEELLLTTDKVSVTPELILDLPKKFSSERICFDPSVSVNSESHYFGHFSYEGKHFSHFIDPIPFFNKYIRKIRDWAQDARDSLASGTDILNSGVLLLSAGNRNNTYFTDFINRVVFDDSAVIIHYDISVNYVDNFVKFFNPHVGQAKYIFIVDDIIFDSETISKLNDVVLFCNNQKKPCDGVFNLICSAGDYALANIKGQLGSTLKKDSLFNAFYYLSMELGTAAESCPICILRDRYNKLAQNSVLDSVKHYFLNKAVKLQVEDIGNLLERKEKRSTRSAKRRTVMSEHSSWARYNPLIGNAKLLPWHSERKNTVNQLYKSYQNGFLPEKTYLRLLVSAELNRILSTDAVIREQFMIPYGKKEHLQRDKKRTMDLFGAILAQVRGAHPFKGWIRNFNEPTRRIFDQIIEELMLAVLTELEFLMIKPIREKVFFWTIIQLNPLLKDYETTDSSFPNFRKIKFFLKKTAVLGSNYALHPLTMERIKKMYVGYNEQIRSINEFQQDKSVQANRMDHILSHQKSADAEERRLYLEQVKRNLQYIEASLREFVYFFVAVLKEATYDSEASVIKLEKTADQLYLVTDASNEKDFYYFLRLIKYENSFILKKGLQTIYDTFSKELNDRLNFNHHPVFRENISARIVSIDPVIQADMDNEISKLIDDYRLIGLKNYLDIQAPYADWKKNNFQDYAMFMELIYLFSLLKNEERKATNVLLETRTQILIQHFFFLAGNAELVTNDTSGKIVYKETHNAGAYLVLTLDDDNQQHINHDKLIVTAVTTPYKPSRVGEIINAPIDDRSLTYIMFNGISNRQNVDAVDMPGGSREQNKPWILWEIFAQADEQMKLNWSSPRGAVYPNKPEVMEDFDKIVFVTEDGLQMFRDFTEGVFLRSNINSLKLIRFTRTEVKDLKIVNSVSGVMGLFAEQAPIDLAPQVELRKLCLSFVLLPQINDYFVNYYNSSNLNSLRDSFKKLIEKEKFKHGQPSFLDNFRKLLELKQKKDEDLFVIELLNNLLKYANNITELLDSYLEAEKHGFSQSQTTKKLGIEKRSATEIANFIQTVYELILKHDFGVTKAVAFEPEIRIKSLVDPSATVHISKTLFEFLMSEVLINAKKYSAHEKFMLDVLIFKNDSGNLMLSISNNCKQKEQKVIDKLNKPMFHSTQGLALVDHILNALFGMISVKEVRPKSDYEHCGGYEFVLTLPIGKIITNV